MKKWIRFFGGSFFSNKISKEAARHGYSSVFLALLLTFAFLWVGYVGADMLPFSSWYNSSADFQETVHALLANSDESKRVEIEILNGGLKFKTDTDGVLVNTFENSDDKKNYSINGYQVVVDSRPADALAEIIAYCVSNDGKETIISYDDYLTLSEVARLNFDFKLRYTGNELILDDGSVASYREYLDGLSEEIKLETQKLADELASGKISNSEYSRAIYELYFTNYYPAITEYESTSKVPLLRNYYYHQYIKEGQDKYIFIFDDYLAGSFKTASGIDISFYGFYTDLENGTLIADKVDMAKANAAADDFIKKSYGAIAPLSIYAHAMNVFSLIPFIALMPMVITILAYSIMKLRGVESIKTVGAAFKIVGSYTWAAALISAVINMLASFLVAPSVLAVLPLLIFFVVLAIRAIIFAINEIQLYIKQLEQETVYTED